MIRRAALPLGLLLLASSGLVAYQVRVRPTRSSADIPSTPLRRAFESGVDSLLRSLKVLDLTIARGDSLQIHGAFRASRVAFKHEEALLWMYATGAAQIASGPLEDDDESPSHALGAPAVFQRVALSVVTSAPSAASRTAAQRDVRYLADALQTFRQNMSLIDVPETSMLDAARIELARVSTLTLAGFEFDESTDAIAETAAALDGVRSLVTVGGAQHSSHVSAVAWATLSTQLDRAINQLRLQTSAERADYFTFLAKFAEPLGEAILGARTSASALDTIHRTVWRSSAATVFGRNAFDAFAFAPDYAVRSTPEVVALGERLFRDPQLSGPGTRSCASCHVASLAFSDGMVRNTAFVGAVTRNTPTLLNVALQPVFFYDRRALRLEDQIAAVLLSPAEMGSSADSAAHRIAVDTAYRSAFAHALPRKAINSMSMRAVLAAYVRSLVRLDSRFDAAVRGDANALSPAERRGFNVFMGKGRCGSCHFAPLFSGTMPPSFTASEPEIIGVPARVATDHATLDADRGVGGFDGVPEHMHSFKVPTLRNVARTAPYMHNGIYTTLEQVVDFYNRGGGLGIGAAIPAQTLPNRPLGLSAAEQRDLIAFLGSLNDSSYLHQLQR